MIAYCSFYAWSDQVFIPDSYYNMKFLYIILFFLDTLFLAFLLFKFFKMIDTGSSSWQFVQVISGMAISIAFMFFSLLRYFKDPRPGNDG